MARYKLQIGGQERYVMFEPTDWAIDDAEVAQLASIHVPDGVNVRRARYAATGGRSWTIVPSTEGCVADILLLRRGDVGPEHFYHLRTQKIYTFLTEGVTVTMSVVDCRSDAPQVAKHSLVKFKTDPRLTFSIDLGVAYRFSADEEVLVRCEHNVFVDPHEPRQDLPPFGSDLLVHELGESITKVPLPSLKCPGAIVYQMAKYEALQHSQTSDKAVNLTEEQSHV
jgi:hypothetical protein